MKRGGPLQRRTPLARGKSLGNRSGGLERKPLPKGQPIRARTSGARKDRRKPFDEADGMPWQEVRLVIFARALGQCEACGRSLNIANMEGHHRRSKGVKGPHRDCPCNALALCSSCHHDEVHGKPEEARELGRILSKLSTTPPTEEPVDIQGRRLFLTCGGTYIDVAA